MTVGQINTPQSPTLRRQTWPSVMTVLSAICTYLAGKLEKKQKRSGQALLSSSHNKKLSATCGPRDNSFSTDQFDFWDGPSADFMRSRISRLLSKSHPKQLPSRARQFSDRSDGQDHYSYVVLKDRPVIAHRTFLHGSAPAPLAPVTSVPRPARACLGSYDPAIVPEAPIGLMKKDSTIMSREENPNVPLSTRRLLRKGVTTAFTTAFEGHNCIRAQWCISFAPIRLIK